MKEASQDFPYFTGQESYSDRVHQEGFTTLDQNGTRWRMGAWSPRAGLSQLDGTTTVDEPIIQVGSLLGRDGIRRIIAYQASGRWVAAAEPDIIWDD